jgi:hypothetical protein
MIVRPRKKYIVIDLENKVFTFSDQVKSWQQGIEVTEVEIESSLLKIKGYQISFRSPYPKGYIMLKDLDLKGDTLLSEPKDGNFFEFLVCSTYTPSKGTYLNRYQVKEAQLSEIIVVGDWVLK